MIDAIVNVKTIINGRRFNKGDKVSLSDVDADRLASYGIVSFHKNVETQTSFHDKVETQSKFHKMSYAKLLDIARDIGIKFQGRPKKQWLIDRIEEYDNT